LPLIESPKTCSAWGRELILAYLVEKDKYAYIFILNIYLVLEGGMASTSLSLGEHWEIFIRNEVASGRYGSASEVIRDALRDMETKKSKLEALRSHLSQGEEQTANGEFVENYSLAGLIAELDQEA
jgi:antitoxin ParD1/3/4